MAHPYYTTPLEQISPGQIFLIFGREDIHVRVAWAVRTNEGEHERIAVMELSSKTIYWQGKDVLCWVLSRC